MDHVTLKTEVMVSKNSAKKKKIIIHNITILLYFYQINAVLVSIRDFSKTYKYILLTPHFEWYCFQ